MKLEEYLDTLYETQWWRWIDKKSPPVYENVEVIDNSKTLPSKEDCEAGMISKQEEFDSKLLDESKQSAFQSESDPLFFKWQAGEATEQEWLDKRNEIKARFS